MSMDFLFGQSFGSFLALVWFTVLFDVPRYALGFLALTIRRALTSSEHRLFLDQVKVSVLLAGHNEAAGIEPCVRTLLEQTRVPDEIIVVSDGSTDAMPKRIVELERAGLITSAHILDLRGGKPAATNLAARFATGDILINIDCDSAVDRYAIEEILKPFLDPEVGAVSGNIQVRNGEASFATAMQAIEYRLSILLGKQVHDMFDQVVCVSGAFGAFRREAYDALGGMMAGPGEDLEMTLALRKRGYKIRFAPDAVCMTDVPPTLKGLFRQRMRWERDSVRLRYRRHRDTLAPLGRGFRLGEAIHQIEFLVFHVLAAAVFPFYLAWILLEFGSFGLQALLAVQVALAGLDAVALICAYPPREWPRLKRVLLFWPVYGLFQGYVMRMVRLFAYVQEWSVYASQDDSYAPAKVRAVRRW